MSPCATSTCPFQGWALHHCPRQPVQMQMFQCHSFPAAPGSPLLLFAVRVVCLGINWSVNFSRLLRKPKDGVICICFNWAVTGCCLQLYQYCLIILPALMLLVWLDNLRQRRKFSTILQLCSQRNKFSVFPFGNAISCRQKNFDN